MKSKTTTLLVLVAVILCLFSCGQPDSPSSGNKTSALDSDGPYLLWDWEKTKGYAYTISQNGKTGTKFADTYWQFSNFCFDDDDTLWYICGDNLYKKEAGYDSVKIENESLSIKDIDYDVASGRFYCVYYNLSSQNYNVKVIEKEDMKNASDFNDVEGSTYSIGNQTKITAAAVDGDTFYAVYDEYELKAYTLTPGSATEKANIYDDELFDIRGNTKDDARVFTDVKAYAGNVYLLGKQVALGEDQNICVSRGAIFMLTLTDSGFAVKGTAGLIPLTTTEKTFADDNDESNTFKVSLVSGIPEKNSSSAVLLGPQKFIAVKPKKLIIADRGVVWVSDKNGISDVELQSRIATVNLEAFTVTSEPYKGNFMNRDILSSDYEFEVSGSGCTKSLSVFDY